MGVPAALRATPFFVEHAASEEDEEWVEAYFSDYNDMIDFADLLMKRHRKVVWGEAGIWDEDKPADWMYFGQSCEYYPVRMEGRGRGVRGSAETYGLVDYKPLSESQ